MSSDELRSAVRTAREENTVLTNTVKSQSGRIRAGAVTAERIDALEERLERRITEGLETAIPEDDEDRRAELAIQTANAEAARRTSAEITRVQPHLDKVVEDSNLDWDDDAFIDARAAWDGNRPGEAFALAKLAVAGNGSGMSESQVQSAIDTALRNAGRSTANSIDTGGDTSGGGTVSNDIFQSEASFAAHLRSGGNLPEGMNMAEAIRRVSR